MEYSDVQNEVQYVMIEEKRRLRQHLLVCITKGH
jgi:hypothetical protein